MHSKWGSAQQVRPASINAKRPRLPTCERSVRVTAPQACLTPAARKAGVPTGIRSARQQRSHTLALLYQQAAPMAEMGR
jgi:hypothetical protein